MEGDGGCVVEKPGQVMRKDKRECTPAKIEAAFTRGHGTEGSPVATFLYRSAMRHGETESQPIAVEFLDAEGLHDFLHHRESKPDGLLQKFSCTGAHNSVTQIIWTPYLARAVRYQNIYKLQNTRVGLYQRSATHEGKSHLCREIVCPPHTVEELSEVCRTVSAHYHSVEHRLVTRLVLYFKLNQNKKTVLLYPSAVITTKFRPQVSRGLSAQHQNTGNNKSERKEGDSNRRVLLDLNPVYQNATCCRDKKDVARAELGSATRKARASDANRELFMTPSGVFLSPNDVLYGLETHPSTKVGAKPRNTDRKKTTKTNATYLKYAELLGNTAAHSTLRHSRMVLSGHTGCGTGTTSVFLDEKPTKTVDTLDLNEITFGGTEENEMLTLRDTPKRKETPIRFCRGGGAGVYEVCRKKKRTEVVPDVASPVSQKTVEPVASLSAQLSAAQNNAPIEDDGIRQYGRLIRKGSYGRVFEHSRDLCNLHTSLHKKKPRQEIQDPKLTERVGGGGGGRKTDLESCTETLWFATKTAKVFDCSAENDDGVLFDACFNQVVEDKGFCHLFFAAGCTAKEDGNIASPSGRGERIFCFDSALIKSLAGLPAGEGGGNGQDNPFSTTPAATPTKKDAANLLTLPQVFSILLWYVRHSEDAGGIYFIKREMPLPELADAKNAAKIAEDHRTNLDNLLIFHKIRQPPGAGFDSPGSPQPKLLSGAVTNKFSIILDGFHPYYYECPGCAVSAATILRANSNLSLDPTTSSSPDVPPTSEEATLPTTPLKAKRYYFGMFLYDLAPGNAVDVVGKTSVGRDILQTQSHLQADLLAAIDTGSTLPSERRSYYMTADGLRDAETASSNAPPTMLPPLSGGQPCPLQGKYYTDVGQNPVEISPVDISELDGGEGKLYTKYVTLLPKGLRGMGLWGFLAQEVQERVEAIVGTHTALSATLEEISYQCYAKRERKFTRTTDHIVVIPHARDALLQGRLDAVLRSELPFVEIIKDTEKLKYLSLAQLDVQSYAAEMRTEEGALELVASLRVWICKKIACVNGDDAEAKGASTHSVRQAIASVEEELRYSKQRRLLTLYEAVLPELSAVFVDLPGLYERQSCCHESMVLRGSIPPRVLACMLGYVSARCSALKTECASFLASRPEGHIPLEVPLPSFTYLSADHS